jgi:hypothetical protein
LFGQAEIENFGVAAIGDEKICGLDVTMDDAFGMRSVERVGNLDAEIKQRFHIERTAVNAVFQRHAFEKFHDDEGASIVLADLVDGADIGMIQRGRGAGFAAETFERLRITDEIFGKEFDGDEAAEFGVFGFVDDTHASAAEFFNDAVMGDGLADRRLGVRHAGTY